MVGACCIRCYLCRHFSVLGIDVDQLGRTGPGTAAVGVANFGAWVVFGLAKREFAKLTLELRNSLICSARERGDLPFIRRGFCGFVKTCNWASDAGAFCLGVCGVGELSPEPVVNSVEDFLHALW